MASRSSAVRRVCVGAVMTACAGLTVLAMPCTARAVPPPCTDASDACLRSIASLYLDALRTHDGSALPLAATVRRTENALTNADGEQEVRESFVRTRMVEGVRDPRFVIDPLTGDVVVFFRIDVELSEVDAKDTTTKAGDSRYEVAVTVPKGSYTVHEAERFRIVAGYITEIEIVAHVETGKGGGGGWPIARSK